MELTRKTAWLAMAAATVAALALGSAGCFSPKFEACAVTCGEASACPDEQFCLGDGKCHASEDEELCTINPDDASVIDGSTPGDDGGTRIDSGGGDGDEDAGADGGEPDASLIDAGPPVSPTSPGDLVITEIHRDPTAAQDPAGEWFEILNPTDSTFDLVGLRVRDADTDFFDIVGSVIVPPGGRVVFARVANPDQNGGVAGVDLEYGELFTLANGEDEVFIENLDPAVILDSVSYGFDFPDVEGASLSLDPDEETSTGNNDAANWCSGQTPYGLGDLGSPGSANPDC